MHVRELGLGVLELVPERFADSRGFFVETYQRRRFHAAGIYQDWVQDNLSSSTEKGVLRGLHFQKAPHAQDKLVCALRGSAFDVAVDIRPGSPSFGKWVSCVLRAESLNQILVPKGFAHGFLTLEPNVEVLYKVSAPYEPGSDRCIAWNDPELAISWPLANGEYPGLSPRDAAAPGLAQVSAELVF